MWELDCEERGAPKYFAFELWCWQRLLRVPWTPRRSSKSILKEISPGCSLEGLMLKLKLQYFGYLMRKIPWCWEGLGAGGEGDDRGWDGWMASLIRWTWVWINSGSWWWTGRPGVLWFMGSQRFEHDWVTELNWKMLSISHGHWLFVYLFGEVLIHTSACFTNWVIFCCWVVGVLCIFWILFSYQMCGLQIFFSIHWVAFSLCDSVLWCAWF